MIYARSNGNPRGLEFPATAARAVSTAALVGYPAGALILRFTPDTLASSAIGYGLILFALVMTALLSGSSVQRITSEEPSKLDEFELAQRHRALGFSYACFTALTLLAVLYAGIATDAGGWVPSTYEEFNGLFWGVFLYATVLPSAFLAWTAPADEQAA
jgi:ABC-type branched-subunit amino acid transport system permease subunit